MKKAISIFATLFLFTAAPLVAQIEAGGSYFTGDSSATYTAASYNQVLGPVGLGAGIFDERAGGALRVYVPIVLGLYAQGQVVGGYTSSDFGAQWSAGGGYKVHLFGPVSVKAEVTYRQEDPDILGFWRTNATDARGVQFSGKLVLGK